VNANTGGAYIYINHKKMETQQSKINPTSPQNSGTPNREYREPQGRIMGGLIIIAVGGVLLARQMGIDLPYWLFNWEMLLIVLGVFIGAKHNFRDSRWLIPVVIGTLLLINHHVYDFNLARYFWPLVIIGIGLFMILKSRRGSGIAKKWQEQYDVESTGTEDVLECVTVFGGVKKNIISKNFKGGEAITVFGGTELNLMQADSNGRVVLELVQVFGGTKLIVPPHWKIHAEEMVTIFGGLNDKRPIPVQTSGDDAKVIVLKGTCLFGGIDIKSY
jgi:predicted membrane protein